MASSTGTAVLLAAIALGVGASILMLRYPHESARTLTVISLAAVFINAASGTTAYARQQRIDCRSGIVFALATLPGAIGDALVVGVVSRRCFSDGHGIRRAAALSIGVVAAAQLGAHVSLRLRGAIIQWLLAGALLALGARLLYTA